MASRGDRGRAPAYQWYPKDYEMDERVKLMSLAQEGAYRRLLDHQWIHGSIPDDMEACAKICRERVSIFAKLWPGVRICFHEAGDGRLVQQRLEQQRSVKADYSETSRKNGEKGAEKRWAAHRAAKAQATGSPSRNDGEPYSDGHREATEPPIGLDDSPISDLQASLSTHTDRAGARETFGPRLMGGEHRAHAACGRVCVPAFLHRQFKDSLGGDEQASDKRLRDWYLAVDSALPEDEPVPTDAAKFWRPRFDATFVSPSVATAPTPVPAGRTGAIPGKYAGLTTGGAQ